jgi:hypothetical protein
MQKALKRRDDSSIEAARPQKRQVARRMDQVAEAALRI